MNKNNINNSLDPGPVQLFLIIKIIKQINNVRFVDKKIHTYIYSKNHRKKTNF